MPAERPIVNVTPGATSFPLQKEIRVNDPQEPEKTIEVPTGPVPPEDEMSAEEREGRRKMEEFYALPVEKQVAKLAVILDRGVLHDRLKVDLPDDLYGEWCRNDPLEIDRMKTLGFWVDNTYATKRSIHSDGSKSNVIADVIHVVTTKLNKEMIDRVRFEQSRRLVGLSKKQQEEDEFAAATARDTGEVIPTFSTSNARAITPRDVRAALAKGDAQTKVQR